MQSRRPHHPSVGKKPVQQQQQRHERSFDWPSTVEAGSQLITLSKLNPYVIASFISRVPNYIAYPWLWFSNALATGHRRLLNRINLLLVSPSLPLQIIQDWKFVSMVLDRFFLWVFTLSSLGGTAGIILQSPSLYDTRIPIPSCCHHIYGPQGPQKAL